MTKGSVCIYSVKWVRVRNGGQERRRHYLITSQLSENTNKRDKITATFFLQKIDETFNVVILIFAREKTAGDCTN